MTQDFAKKPKNRNSSKTFTFPFAAPIAGFALGCAATYGLISLRTACPECEICTTCETNIAVTETPKCPEPEIPEPPTCQPAAAEVHETESDEETQPSKIHYGFFTDFENAEVPIDLYPEKNNYAPKNDQKRIYYIQVAAYRLRESAESDRTKLQDLDLKAEVVKATSSNGSIWYRVVIGPIHTRSMMHSIQNRLFDHGFNAQTQYKLSKEEK